MKTIINIIKKHKHLILSLIIFAIVFCILGVPFKGWWFNGGDDFHGLYLGYKTKTWNDLFNFFLNGHTNQGMGASNCLSTFERNTSFFSTFYRPLYCVYFAIQYWIFGTNAYYYLLTSVFFHSINTVILFNIFLWFTSLFPAFLIALLFAFHPQIAYRFGAIVNLHYYINVMLMLLSILFLKKYLDSKKLFYYFFSCMLFTLSLFTRESSIVLPAIIFLGLFLYPSPKNTLNLKKLFKHSITNVKISSGFWVILSVFFSLRLYLYPLASKLNTQNNSLFKLIKEKIPEFKVFIYDALHLSWLPWGHKTIRGIIVITLFILFIWLFIKNSKKIYIIYFIIATFLMLWPSYLGHYNPRYFYETHIFVLLTFIFLFKYHKENLLFLKKPFILGLIILNIFQITFAIENFSRRETKMKIMSKAIKKIINNPQLQKKSLCFLGYPSDGFGGHFAGLIWIFQDNPSIHAYFDTKTIIKQLDSNIVSPVGWKNMVSEYYKKNFVKITPIKNGFRFKSSNSKKVAFNLNEKNGCSMGKKIIHKTKNINGEKLTTDFTLIIDKKYIQEKIIFFTWDYEKQKFVIIR